MITVDFTVKDRATGHVLWEGSYHRVANKEGRYRYVEVENPTGDPTKEIEVVIRK